MAGTTRHPGTPAPLTRLDGEVARYLTRFPGARPDAICAWTGASPDGTRKALRRLVAHRMVRRVQRQLELRAAGGMVRETTAGVWVATPRGARLAGTWRTPGSGMQVTLEAGGVSRAMADHLTGVAGLAAWYRHGVIGPDGAHRGFEVGGEREVLSLERPSNLSGIVTAQLTSYWSVSIPGRRGVHPPDLVAVGRHPQTGEPVRFAIELERATKEVTEYREVLAAYRDAHLPVVWHVLHRRTWERLTKAAAGVGHQWSPSPAPGVNVSSDGMLRMQGWAPGKVLADVSTWAPRWNLPGTIPAGLDAYATPQELDTWRQGRVVPHDQEPLWTPLEMWDAA